MSTKIKGAEYPLAKIFSSDFDYEIPSFQRPYAWTEEEADDLLDDLYDFCVNGAEDEQYFLGSIVLVKEGNLSNDIVPFNDSIPFNESCGPCAFGIKIRLCFHKRVVRTPEGQEVTIFLTVECIVLLAPLSVCG